MIPIDRSETCFFTGHRVIDGDHASTLQPLLDSTIASLVDSGKVNFVCGGAVGFDTFAACRVIIAKKKNKDIRLILVLPCRDQTVKWKNMTDLTLYQRIKGFADEIIYASDLYTSSCMHDRNRMMADMSGVCVAYYGGGPGGTAFTVSYAKEKGIEIINLYDELKK